MPADASSVVPDISDPATGHIVISRRTRECIDIGGVVRVEVARIRNGEVKLVVHAPREVRVVRSELPRHE